MRHVIEEFDVFTFDELSPTAKEKARDWFRECLDRHDWSADEFHASLKAFIDLFDGRLRDYSYPNRGYIDVEWRLDDFILEMYGVRLWKWLDVRLAGSVTVSDGGIVGSKENPYRSHKERVGGHAWINDAAEGGCPLTGCFTDCALFDPLREFVKRPDARTLAGLLRDCLKSFIDAAQEAYDYCYADEYADETIRTNEYEFLENGKHYA